MRTRMLLSSLALLIVFPLAALPTGAEPVPDRAKETGFLAASASSHPRLLASLGRVALLLAEEGPASQGEVGIWRTDGTAVGTFRLPVCSPACGTTPRLLAVAGRRAYFTLRAAGGDDEIWVSNGAVAGTFRVAGGFGLPISLEPFAAWVASRNLLFFLAADAGRGLQLWRSDGTPAGTFRLTDLDGVGSELAIYGGRAYFKADQGSSAGALFHSDGTPQGTVMLKDPLPGAASGPQRFKVVGGKLVFLTFRAATGSRLWCSDGTNVGTAVCGGFPNGTFIDFEGTGTTASGRLFFLVVVPGRGVDVAVTDGTPQGTRIVTTIHSPNSFPGHPSAYFRPGPDGRSVFFLADDGSHGTEVWRSDGTVAGTRLVKDVCPGLCSGVGFLGQPAGLGQTAGSRFYFAGRDEAGGVEPWSSDGTAAGTRRVADLCPGPCSSSPVFSSAHLGARIAFLTSREGVIGTWATDGTAAGTVRVATANSGTETGFLPFEAPPVGGVLLGAGADPEHGVELWRSDLTPGGTRLVVDLNVAATADFRPQGLLR